MAAIAETTAAYRASVFTALRDADHLNYIIALCLRGAPDTTEIVEVKSRTFFVAILNKFVDVSTSPLYCSKVTLCLTL